MAFIVQSGMPVHPSTELVMSLIALALALSVSQGPPLPLMQSGMLGPNGYFAFLTIAPDGHWTAVGDQSGMLAPDELDQIVTATENMELETHHGPPCTEMQNLRLMRLKRGSVRYADDCGPMADPSVMALLELAESLTIERANPLVTRLDRWPTGDRDRKESIILRRDGVWTTDNGAGNTAPERLAEIAAAFDAARLEVEPTHAPASCKVELNNELEIPGRGTLRWDAPCRRPSPALAAALARLFSPGGRYALTAVDGCQSLWIRSPPSLFKLMEYRSTCPASARAGARNLRVRRRDNQTAQELLLLDLALNGGRSAAHSCPGSLSATAIHSHSRNR